MSHRYCRASDAIDVSRRKRLPALGTPTTTRSAVSPAGVDGVGRRQQLFGERGAADVPDLRESALDLGDGRPADLHAGVAPGLETLRRIAFPARAHAQAGHECDGAVDGDRLAMIARDPAERAAEAERVERAHLGARLLQLVPDVVRSEASQPVVHHPHGDARARTRRERADEATADNVVGDDVALEEDRSLARPRWRRATPGSSRRRRATAGRRCRRSAARRSPAAARGRSAQACRTRRWTWASREG